LVETDRKVIDVVYLVEWGNSNPPNVGHPDTPIAPNGMTVDSIPGSHCQRWPTADGVFRTIGEDANEIALFSTVVFIPTILTTATNYGTETETGLRNLFLAYGLPLSVNCFITSFKLTIPYAIMISAIQ
jgi:hypothetical protein